MRKIRFAIIGSGFRALEYVRVTKALSDHFELCALLTRTEEKRDLLCKQYGIHTTCSIDEVLSLSPDFVVVAVDKAHIAEVSMEWSNRGIPVLCETPIAMDIDSLCKIHDLYLKGRKIIVAEQYHLFPENIARMKLIDMDLIGEPYYLNISLAHEYHCTSLIRRFLKLDTDTAFSAEAKDFFFPGKQIMTRYERFTDGRIADMKRTLALFTFENNKVALYDFDSDQYRSPIRNDHYKLQGVNGEILNDTVVYIDENADPCKKSLDFTSRIVRTDSDNPNYSRFTEIEKITYDSITLYEPEFGLRKLSQNETAMASLLKKMADYVKGGAEPYPFTEGLQDAYMAILLRKAIETGDKVESQKMPWNR